MIYSLKLEFLLKINSNSVIFSKNSGLRTRTQLDIENFGFTRDSKLTQFYAILAGLETRTFTRSETVGLTFPIPGGMFGPLKRVKITEHQFFKNFQKIRKF